MKVTYRVELEEWYDDAEKVDVRIIEIPHSKNAALPTILESHTGVSMIFAWYKALAWMEKYAIKGQRRRLM